MIIATCRSCLRDDPTIDSEDTDIVDVKQKDGVFKYHKKCADALDGKFKV